MKHIGIIVLVALALLAGAARALSPEEVKLRLHKARPDIPVTEVRQSTIEGFYEVILPGGQTLFVTKDGDHFIAGDLYRVNEDGFVNLTEEERGQTRAAMIAAIDDAEKLIFSPPEDQVKATINVFTDVDCAYCRKLHREMAQLNDLGIAVKYLAYPRGGRQSPSWDKTVSVWCAENPKDALTRAKLGEQIPEKTCDNPVAEQYDLGNRVGVTGTPAIVYEDGRLQPGYVPAREMAARLGIE